MNLAGADADVRIWTARDVGAHGSSKTRSFGIEVGEPIYFYSSFLHSIASTPCTFGSQHSPVIAAPNLALQDSRTCLIWPCRFEPGLCELRG
jgi:hypothetical protein